MQARVDAPLEGLQLARVCRHRFGGDEVGPADARAGGHVEAVGGPCAVGAQPQGDAGDLDGASVDVDSVQVVAHHQFGHGGAQCFEGGVVVVQRGAGGVGTRPVAVVPRLFVDLDKQVECVQEEVSATARGVDDAQVTRVLGAAVGGGVGLALHRCRADGAAKHEGVVWAPDEVPALVAQSRVAAAHLVPRAPKGVVGQELHDVARGEELVAHCQFAAGARGGAGLAHAIAFGAVVVVLVDPPDRLILRPEGRDLRGVEGIEKRCQARGRGEVAGLGGGPVEEGGQINREFVEGSLKERPIGCVAVAEGAIGHAIVGPETLRCGALGEDGEADDTAFLGHSQRNEAVEGGEASITHHAGVGVGSGGSLPPGETWGTRVRAPGRVVKVVRDEVAKGDPGDALGLGEAGDGVEVQGDAAVLNAEAAQAIGDIVGQCKAGLVDKGFQALPGWYVEWHLRIPVRRRCRRRSHAAGGCVRR